MAQVATAEILLFSWIFTIIVVQEVEKFEHPLGRHTGFVPDNYVESFKSVSNYVDLFIYSFDEGRFMFYSTLFDFAISHRFGPSVWLTNCGLVPWPSLGLPT